jgi:UDP-N-acetylglucosamine 2-epimerase
MPLIRALDGIPLKKIWINSNIDAGSREIAKLLHKTDWEFRKNLTPEEYYRLLNGCKCAVGNSSSFLKEGAYLGIPAVIVGSRQKDRESQFNVVFVTDKDESAIAERICHRIDVGRWKPSYEYGDGNASKKIVTVLREVAL